MFKTLLHLVCLRAVDSKFRYELTGPLIYQRDRVETITVPAGFKTDFASVPWFFQSFIPKVGRYNEATVVHDYLCYLANKGEYSRKQADKVFLECMRSLGCSTIRRGFMYAGVATYTFFKWGKK